MNSMDILEALGETAGSLVWDAQRARSGGQKQPGKRPSLRKIWLMAAAIVLALLLVGCAVAYMLKMEHFKIGEGTEQWNRSAVDGVYAEEPHTANTSTLTLAGLKGTNAYKACADFYAFYEEYTAGIEKMEEEGALPEGYWESGTYQDTLEEKALALANRYGLKPEGELLNFRTVRNMCDALGVERFVQNSHGISADINYGRCYESGNFRLEMQFRFPEDRGYEVVNTYGCLFWNRQDTFSWDYVTIVDSGDWVEQNYTTSSGGRVLILRSPSQEQGYILCDRGEALMTLKLDVNIKLLSVVEGVVSVDYRRMTQEQLEMVADTIDFSIQPRIPTQSDVDAQKDIPGEATQNGFTLQLKSAETDGYVAKFLLGITAPEGTVLRKENNVIISNFGWALTPANEAPCRFGGSIDTVDDQDGLENTIDLLLEYTCTMEDGGKPFAQGTAWNLHLVDIVASEWDAANQCMIDYTLAEGEWQFAVTFDETNSDYREVELVSEPVKMKACTGWKADGTAVLEEYTVTSFILRRLSSDIVWVPGTENQGAYVDFYGWTDRSMYAVMKDGTQIKMTGRNSSPIDLDQVDHILLPDGTILNIAR